MNMFNTKYKTWQQTNPGKNELNEFQVMTKQRMYCCIFYSYSMLFLLLLWHNNMHPTPVQPIQSARGKHVSHDVQAQTAGSELPNASDIPPPPPCETDPGHVISCHSERPRTAAEETAAHVTEPCDTLYQLVAKSGVVVRGHKEVGSSNKKKRENNSTAPTEKARR